MDPGLTQLKLRVRELRPLFLPPDPCQRTDYAPGELAQWDLWFPPAAVPVGVDQVAKLPVVLGVSGYSRWIVARMIPSREAHDILGGHLACLRDLGAVPRKGVYDNEAALVSRHGGPVRRSRAPLVVSAETLRARRLIEHRDWSPVGGVVADRTTVGLSPHELEATRRDSSVRVLELTHPRAQRFGKQEKPDARSGSVRPVPVRGDQSPPRCRP